MQVIDMDEIAHNAYRVARYPESVKEADSLASADAFVINADNMWYFIEFKNQEITKAKDSVTKQVSGSLLCRTIQQKRPPFF